VKKRLQKKGGESWESGGGGTIGKKVTDVGGERMNIDR